MLNKMKNLEKYRILFYTIIFCFVFFFRQVVGYFFYSETSLKMYYFIVGNFDIFYLLSLFWFFDKKKKNDFLFFPLILVFVILGLQLLFIDNLSIVKAIINATKIIICFFVFFGSYKNVNKIDYNFFVKLFGILCYLFLILAFVFKGSILWRHNDAVNSFNLTRLKFLYTEPSELGLHCILVLMIALNFFITLKSKREKVLIFVSSILPLLVTIYFSKSMGAFCVGGLSIIISLIYYMFKVVKSSQKRGIIILALILITIISIPFIIQTSTYRRVVNTFTKIDYSNNYRIFVPFKVAGYSLVETRGIGIGLGNAELPNNVLKYKKLGLGSAGIINSFMNFIAEGGIFALIIVIYIIYFFGKIVFKEKAFLKMGLFLFIIMFQFMGTYFTNPLCWMIYAFIYGYIDDSNNNCSDDKKEIKSTIKPADIKKKIVFYILKKDHKVVKHKSKKLKVSR